MAEERQQLTSQWIRPALRHVLVAAICLSVSAAVNSSAADPPNYEQHLKKITTPDAVDKAIEGGLTWLVKRQNSETGQFDDKMPNTMTGLSCLALMAAGHFPDRSDLGTALEKGLIYLATQGMNQDGYFGAEGNGRMYTQGICTLALADGYGMLPTPEQNRRIQVALQKAVALILKAQHKKRGKHHGGWRYQIQNTDSDLSVSAWQILALRAARDCHIPVPDQALTDAAEFVRRCYNPRDKAFTYNGGNASPSMRAAGVVCLLALGEDEAEADQVKIRNSASFLLNFDPSKGKYFYYQSYYVSTAATMLDGKYRQQIRNRLEKTLLRNQKRDGQFLKHQGAYGGTYATAMAVICLSSRNRLLPVYRE